MWITLGFEPRTCKVLWELDLVKQKKPTKERVNQFSPKLGQGYFAANLHFGEIQESHSPQLGLGCTIVGRCPATPPIRHSDPLTQRTWYGRVEKQNNGTQCSQATRLKTPPLLGQNLNFFQNPSFQQFASGHIESLASIKRTCFLALIVPASYISTYVASNVSCWPKFTQNYINLLHVSLVYKYRLLIKHSWWLETLASDQTSIKIRLKRQKTPNHIILVFRHSYADSKVYILHVI